MISSAHPQRGGVILSLAIGCFIISLLLASGVGWLLWRDSQGSWPNLRTLWTTGTLPTATPPPTENPTSSLDTPLTVHPDLFSHTVELEDQLKAPLRAYYATKPERLGKIQVKPSDVPEHTTQVTYELAQGSAVTTHTFYYDRTGKDKEGPYPTWEPGMLDNTE